MAEDWKPGDLALCIKRDGGGMLNLPFIEQWQILTVETVIVDGPFTRAVNPDELMALGFDGWPVAEDEHFVTGYDARCFRKVRPIEADEFDREVIEAMSGQPVVVA